MNAHNHKPINNDEIEEIIQEIISQCNVNGKISLYNRSKNNPMICEGQ